MSIDTDSLLQFNPCEIIHLKGFVTMLDFKKYKKEIDRAVEILRQPWVTAIAFDGDLPTVSGITPKSYVDILCHEALKGKHLIAYRKESGVASFRKSWNPKNLDIEIRVAPNALSWKELGTYALNDTGATYVLTVGGGKTVAAEYDAAKNKDIYWAVVPVFRESAVAEGTAFETPSLMQEPYRSKSNVHCIEK
jgi:hypothetical protein